MADQGLTPAAFHVLLALATRDRHGYAIMLDTAETGFRMGPGTLYGTIKRLLERALIEEIRVADDDDPRRRHYRITKDGRALLGAETARMASLVDRATERGVLAAQSARARRAPAR